MSTDRWVDCQFCQQTYLAGRGDRCALCGKTGGLLEVPPPPPDLTRVDRASWGGAVASDGGGAVLVGCAGILVGAVLGVFIAVGLITTEDVQPAQPGNAESQCGLFAIGLIFSTIGAIIAGAVAGAVCGGLASLLALPLLTRLNRRPLVQAGEPTAERPIEDARKQTS